MKCFFNIQNFLNNKKEFLKMKNSEKDEKECTFQPKLIKTKKKDFKNNYEKTKKNEKFNKKNEMNISSKENLLERNKYKKNLNYVKKENLSEIKGFDNLVERLERGRKMKENIEKLYNDPMIKFRNKSPFSKKVNPFNFQGDLFKKKKHAKFKVNLK